MRPSFRRNSSISTLLKAAQVEKAVRVYLALHQVAIKLLATFRKSYELLYQSVLDCHVWVCWVGEVAGELRFIASRQVCSFCWSNVVFYDVFFFLGNLCVLMSIISI